MPYSQQHMLLQAIGTLGTSPINPFEQFSFGIRFTATTEAGLGGLGALDTDEFGQSMAGTLYQKWTDQNCGISDMARLRSVKWNRIGVDGRYASDGETREILVGEGGGVGGGGRPVFYNAPQIALAITLRTGRSRGLARAGRFYLPAPSFQADNNTGTILDGQAQAMATFWGGWLDGLALNVGPINVGAQAVVMSKGRNNGAGAGVTEPVTAVDCGVVLDTIRSRRNQIDERYRRYEFGSA